MKVPQILPPYLSILNPSHPEAPDKFVCVLAPGCITTVDLIRGAGSDSSGSATTVTGVGPFGPIVMPAFTGTECYDFGNLAALTGLAMPITVVYIGTCTSNTRVRAIGVGRSGTNSFAFGPENNGSGKIDLIVTKGGVVDAAASIQAAAVNPTGDCYFAGVSMDATGMIFYARNYTSGLTASGTNANTQALTAGATESTVGCWRSGAGARSEFFRGGLQMLWVAGRSTSADRFAALSLNPYAIFSEPAMTRWGLKAAA